MWVVLLLLAALSPVTYYRARIGALSRDRQSNDPELVGARRDLVAAKLKEHVEKVSAKLTADQRDAIAKLLLDGSR